MKIEYTVKFSIDLERSEYLGSTPKEHVQHLFDEDPQHLFQASEVESIKIGKVLKGEATSVEDDEDDDGLTEFDADDLEMED